MGYTWAPGQDSVEGRLSSFHVAPAMRSRGTAGVRDSTSPMGVGKMQQPPGHRRPFASLSGSSSVGGTGMKVVWV